MREPVAVATDSTSAVVKFQLVEESCQNETVENSYDGDLPNGSLSSDSILLKASEMNGRIRCESTNSDGMEHISKKDIVKKRTPLTDDGKG